MKSRITLILTFLSYLGICQDFTGDEKVINALANYRNGTCLLIFDGAYTCTGTILNNTSEDGSPLILSAAHCIERVDQIESIVAVFGRQRLVAAANYEGIEWRSKFGAELLAYSDELDYVLLELNEDIPSQLMPIFMGWNTGQVTPGTMSTIYHPTFDYKELAYSEANPATASFEAIEGSPSEGFWEIDHWNFGTTTQGASGAALTDLNMNVVGILSGSFYSSNDSSDFYAKFNNAWSASIDPSDRLSTYLNPEELAITNLRGITYKDTQNLSKIKNFEYLDVYSANFQLSTNNPMVQEFAQVASGDAVGLYLTIGQINSSLLNSITVEVLSENQVINIEEVNLFTLVEGTENYIPFITENTLTGDVRLSITLNTSDPSDFVEIPTVVNNEQEHSLNSLLIRNAELTSESTNTSQNTAIIYPNPTSGFAICNHHIKSAVLTESTGKKIRVSVTNNFANQSTLNLTNIPRGLYLLNVVTFDDQTVSTKIVLN